MDDNCLPVGNKGLMRVNKLAGESNGILKLLELKNNHKVLQRDAQRDTKENLVCVARYLNMLCEKIVVCFV